MQHWLHITGTISGFESCRVSLTADVLRVETLFPSRLRFRSVASTLERGLLLSADRVVWDTRPKGLRCYPVVELEHAAEACTASNWAGTD